MLESEDERSRILSTPATFDQTTKSTTASETSYVQPGEELPFRVRVVRTERQLQKAIKVRADAYARHTPAFADTLRSVEEDDKSPSSLIFLCESKITGDAVGTLRIHTNFDAPTYLERVLELPEFLRSTGIAYVTRLAVVNGTNGTFVKLAMFKALHRYCFATQISWLLAVARQPVDRDLTRLGFKDLLEPGDKLYRPEDFGNVDVRPLCFSVLKAEHNWRLARHPLYDFMALKTHPDIEVFSSVSSAWATPRRMRTGRQQADLDLPTRQILVV